jgi:L-2-hydroxyglutarate oxidase
MATHPNATINSFTRNTPADNLKLMTQDVIVVGGGVVGLATAFRLLETRPGLRLVLLEKEPKLAAHQTGNNSGVLHSGLY